MSLFLNKKVYNINYLKFETNTKCKVISIRYKPKTSGPTILFSLFDFYPKYVYHNIIREHPFNVKGGRGYGCFGVKKKIRFAAQQKKILDNLTLLFFYNNNIYY